MLMLIMLFMMASCERESGASGFNSPEAAVIAYLEGLRDSDLDRMINAFALEVYIENYDFEAFLNRVRAYIPMQEVRMPNTNEFVTAMNIESRRASIIDGITFQYISLSDPDFDVSLPITIEEGEAGAFISHLNDNLDALDLLSLEILGFIPPEALIEIYLSEANQNILVYQAVVQGVDELVNCVAVFELDGNRYLLTVEVGNFDGQWYLLQLGGNVSALLGIGWQQQGIIPVESIDDLDLDLEALIISP